MRNHVCVSRVIAHHVKHQVQCTNTQTCKKKECKLYSNMYKNTTIFFMKMYTNALAPNEMVGRAAAMLVKCPYAIRGILAGGNALHAMTSSRVTHVAGGVVARRIRRRSSHWQRHPRSRTVPQWSTPSFATSPCGALRRNLPCPSAHTPSRDFVLAVRGSSR